jgi:hypothetical protein
MLHVPTPKNKAFFRQRVTLDGADYMLDFAWNMRSGWYVGLSAVSTDGNLVQLFAPRRMLSSRNLLRFTTSDLRPRGWLGCLDLAGAGAPATFENLNTQVELIYIPQDEYEALLAG